MLAVAWNVILLRFDVLFFCFFCLFLLRNKSCLGVASLFLAVLCFLLFSLWFVFFVLNLVCFRFSCLSHFPRGGTTAILPSLSTKHETRG